MYIIVEFFHFYNKENKGEVAEMSTGGLRVRKRAHEA